MATRYGLESSGIESQCAARFSASFKTSHGAKPTYCKMGTGVKRPRHGVDHPPISSTQVEERVLHLWAIMTCSKTNMFFILVLQSAAQVTNL